MFKLFRPLLLLLIVASRVGLQAKEPVFRFPVPHSKTVKNLKPIPTKQTKRIVDPENNAMPAGSTTTLNPVTTTTTSTVPPDLSEGRFTKSCQFNLSGQSGKTVCLYSDRNDSKWRGDAACAFVEMGQDCPTDTKVIWEDPCNPGDYKQESTRCLSPANSQWCPDPKASACFGTNGRFTCCEGKTYCKVSDLRDNTYGIPYCDEKRDTPPFIDNKTDLGNCGGACQSTEENCTYKPKNSCQDPSTFMGCHTRCPKETPSPECVGACSTKDKKMCSMVKDSECASSRFGLPPESLSFNCNTVCPTNGVSLPKRPEKSDDGCQPEEGKECIDNVREGLE